MEVWTVRRGSRISGHWSRDLGQPWRRAASGGGRVKAYRRAWSTWRTVRRLGVSEQKGGAGQGAADLIREGETGSRRPTVQYRGDAFLLKRETARGWSRDTTWPDLYSSRASSCCRDPVREGE